MVDMEKLVKYLESHLTKTGVKSAYYVITVTSP